MEVIVLGADCVVTRKYVELVRNRMRATGRHGVVVACTDRQVHDRYGVQNRCQPSVCPGCGFMAPLNGEYLPAMVVDGQVKLHSFFPREQEVDQAFKGNLLERTTVTI